MNKAQRENYRNQRVISPRRGRIALFVVGVCSVFIHGNMAFGQAARKLEPTTRASGTVAQSLKSESDVIKSKASPLDVRSSFTSSIQEAKRLYTENPNTAKLRIAQRKAVRLAEQLNRQLEDQVNALGLSDADKTAIKGVSQDVSEWTMREMEQAGIPVSGTILKDPKAGYNPANLQQVEMSIRPGTREETLTEAKEHRGLGMRLLNKGVGAGKHFSSQYVTLGAAQALMTIAQLGASYKDNPVALEQFIESQKDPVAAVGLAFFIAVNHPVAMGLSGIIKGDIPRMMIPYYGMMAGSLASSTFHALWADAELWKCGHSYFTKTGRDEDSCNKAFDNWVPTNKIIEFTPGLISMAASQAIADAGRAAIMTGIQKRAASKAAGAIAEETAINVAFRGMTIEAASATARLAKIGATAALGGFSPVSIVIGGVQLIAFFAIDAVISEPINQWKTEATLATFNLKTWLDRFGWHREFWRPAKDANQMITNAFDVEATDLRSAHHYMVMNFNTLGSSAWKQPNDVNKCVPPEIAERKLPGFLSQPVMFIPGITDLYHVIYRTAVYSKSKDQLRCEVLARPTELVARYAELNKSWRETLLAPFTRKQQSWLQLIGRFNNVMMASTKIAEYITDAKFKMTHSGGPRPDFSREALRKVLEGQSAGAAPAGADEAHAPAVQPTSVAGLATPELVDYVVASLACGVRLDQAATPRGRLAKLWDKANEFITKQTSDSAYLKTRLGSSFTFEPPNITIGNGSICNGGNWTVGAVEPYSSTNEINPPDVLSGEFKDDASGKTYRGLPDYIFDNLLPELSETNDRFSPFSTWWQTHILSSIEPVWMAYKESYDKLVATDFMPIVFDRTFRNGCTTAIGRGQLKTSRESDAEGFIPQTSQQIGSANGAQECTDSGTAYRVGKGAYLSVEIELRNYLRGLYSLHSALYAGQKPEALKAAQKDFMTAANEVLSRVLHLGKDDLKSDDINETIEMTQAKAAALSDLVVARLDEVNEPKDGFRRASQEQLMKLVGALIAEQGDYANQVRMMNLSDAVARPVDQSVYKNRPSGPFNQSRH